MIEPPALAGSFRTDLRARAAFAEGAGIYRIVPAAVAIPAGLSDLRLLVRWAEESGTGLIPRGAGSGMPGGSVGPGVVVQLSGLPRVMEIDPVARVARTSPTVTLAELNSAAQSNGLRLPPDPSSGGWASLGGMVSTNASGARSVRYGSVRPWVRGLEVVGGEGEVYRMARRSDGQTVGRSEGQTVGQFVHQPSNRQTVFSQEVAPQLRAASDLIRRRFPRTRKNSSGYALDAWLESGDDLDLFIGAEGTLGIVTEIGWRLDPIPAAHASLLLALPSLGDLEAAVTPLLRLQPSAIELLDRTFLELVRSSRASTPLPAITPGTEAVLIVEFERSDSAAVRGAVGDAVRAMNGIASDVLTALTDEEEQRLWALRHAASPILAGLPAERRSMQVIEDACVPLPKLGEYIRVVRDAAKTRGLLVVIFGHAGDGNVHVNVLPELARPDWLTQLTGLMDEVNRAAIDLGGTLSGEHGDGRLRAGWLERQYGSEIVALFRAVKTAFDPRDILNPGVILGDSAPALRQLKVGPDAAPLPADIAAALREIERTGGYARNRLEIAGGE